MPIVDPKVEIEFVAGTWTDVTADVDLSTGIAIKFGRTSEFSDPQTGTCDFQLANHLGGYMPRAQVLTDGTTAHPYYPNVVPRKRVRVSNASGNRFLGYIKSWQPSLENGVRPVMTVSASDRLDQLARTTFKSFYEEELALTAPACSYLLSDTPASSGAAAVFLDDLTVNQPLVQVNAGPVPFTSGTALPMPQPDGLTGVTVSASASNSNALLGTVTLSASAFAMSVWFTIPVVATGSPLAGFTAALFNLKNGAGFYGTLPEPNADVQMVLTYGTGTGAPLSVAAGVLNGPVLAQLGTTLTGTVADDGKPHHYMMIGSTSGGTQTFTAYIDGVSIGSTSFTSGQLPVLDHFDVTTTAGANASPVIGPIAAWATAPAATVPGLLARAGNGRVGDLSGQRVTRLLTYAGLAPADYSVDAGKEVLSGSQGIRGKSAVAACQDIATTEGDGSAFYMNMDGLARFCDRTFRKPSAPNLTLSASLDLDGPFAPTLDELTLVNQSTVTRGGGNDLTYTDAVSTAQYGATTDSATSYASTDAAALALAQQRVVAQSAPAVRLTQFTVDLVTSSVAASAFVGMQIGWRARITSLPAGVSAASQLDVIIEGWSEQITKTSWAITFDTSPADTPAQEIWDDATYGRWQASGCTLGGSLTNSATTLVVVTIGGFPTFTTDPTMYPFRIIIGDEHIQLNAAPGGTTSPQTFTGVTRGVDGTVAAAQSSGASVNLFPTSTWTL